MRFPFLLLAFTTLTATTGTRVQERQILHSPKERQEAQRMTLTSLTEKKICWTFDDGPMPNTRIEHMFNEDGSVTWLIHRRRIQGSNKDREVVRYR